MRIVLDSGVLIAALLSRDGAPAKVFLAWRAGGFDLLVSPKLLAELGRVLVRPKFRRYLTEEDAERFVDLVSRGALLLEDQPGAAGLTRDPGDDYLVALARTGEARYLVSGDPHLTTLRDPEPPVLTPRQFLTLLER